MRRAEQLIASIIGAVGVAAIAGSFTLPAGYGGDLGPGLFPGILGLASVLAAIGVWLGAARTPPDRVPEIHGRWRLALGGLCLSGTYLAAVPIIGYFVATPLFMASIQYYLGARSLRPVVGTALGFTAGAWVIFVWLFAVPLPGGPLDQLFS